MGRAVVKQAIERRDVADELVRMKCVFRDTRPASDRGVIFTMVDHTSVTATAACDTGIRRPDCSLGDPPSQRRRPCRHRVALYTTLLARSVARSAPPAADVDSIIARRIARMPGQLQGVNVQPGRHRE